MSQNLKIIRRKDQKHIVWGKTTSNDAFGFCQNVTFEDDEFKEDNKALNDQAERELMLFCLP